MPIYRSQFDSSSVENVIQISEQYLCIECTSIFLYLEMGGYSLVARLLATETLCIRIQASQRKPKWATLAKEWPTRQKIHKEIFFSLLSQWFV